MPHTDKNSSLGLGQASGSSSSELVEDVKPKQRQKPSKWNLEINIFNRISSQEKAFFATQISVMLNAGIHLAQAIKMVKEQVKHKYFQTVLDSIYNDVRQGHPLSFALARYPSVFNRVFLNMVKAGESSGRLAHVLRELGLDLTRNVNLSHKLKGALAYPAFVTVVMIAVAILTSVKIIPDLTNIFTEMDVELPWTTKAVMAFSDFLINYWFWIVLAVVAISAGVVWFVRTEEGRLLADRLILRDPTGINQKIEMARFTRTLGSLVRSGLPIIDAVLITSEAVGNKILAKSLQGVAKQLEKGVPMSVPLKADANFPLMISQMVAVGEQTGKLDESLESLAKFYGREAQDSIEGLTKIFEPAVIVIIALGVAVLVFSVIVPIYSISQGY